MDSTPEIAIKIEEIIESHKIRDWDTNIDVQNSMVSDIEDYLFSIKGRYDLELTYEEIDDILDSTLKIAKRRDKR